MTVRDDLTDINGVGETTADKIMTVFEDYESSDVPEDVRSNLEDAMSYYDAAQYEYAGKFLRRVMEDLD